MAARAGTPLPHRSTGNTGSPPIARTAPRRRGCAYMFENEQPGYQPGRQRRLPRSQPTHRAEPSRQKVPIDRPRQLHQRMAKVDDLLEKRAKQVVLAIVARLAHRSPPTANLAVEGITDHPNGESQTAIKPACTPGFLAKSIPCSGQIIAINQSLPNSSRTTIGQ